MCVFPKWGGREIASKCSMSRGVICLYSDKGKLLFSIIQYNYWVGIPRRTDEYIMNELMNE